VLETFVAKEVIREIGLLKYQEFWANTVIGLIIKNIDLSFFPWDE